VRGVLTVQAGISEHKRRARERGEAVLHSGHRGCSVEPKGKCKRAERFGERSEIAAGACVSWGRCRCCRALFYGRRSRRPA
jgi:hypothetical protein